MLVNGILNPHINSLLSRVRHTNTLVIADRGFPFWPMIETVDIALVDDVPTVLQILEAIQGNFVIARCFMAAEFLSVNSTQVKAAFANMIGDIPVEYEPHTAFKVRVPNAIGLIRSADTTQYANIILESG